MEVRTRTSEALHIDINLGASVNHPQPQRLQGDKEEVQSSSWTLHSYIFVLIGMVFSLLQVNQGTGAKSPLVTDHITMVTFIIDIFIYIGLLTIIKKHHFSDLDLTKFIDNMSLCFGWLAPILLLVVLVRALGWFIFSLWILYFLRDFVVDRSYKRALAYIWNKVKELFKGQEQNEAGNKREHSEAENEIEVQEMQSVIELPEADDQSIVVPENSREEEVREKKMELMPTGKV